MPKMTTDTTVAGLTRRLRKVPKAANAELRDAAGDIARFVASDAQAGARHVGGVAALVAPAILVGRDRVPVIRLGSTAQLPTSGNGWERKRQGRRQTLADVAMGAEFGGQGRPSTRQFRPHRGKRGYFLWPAVRQDSDRIQAAYSAALDAALDRI